ncbi:MAG: DUF3800 domain-containing protein [Acidimicrobiales bacterium]
MYVDESGDSGLPADRSPTRYFCLSGVVVHELRWREVLWELTEFRRWIKRRYGIYLEDELHHAEMVGKTKKLAESLVKLPKYERLAIIRHHADKLANLHDLNVINVVVDKATGKLPDKESVFRGAWYRLFQRFENTIQHQNFPGPKNPSERGMVFPDSTDGEKLRKYLNKMRVRNPIKIPGQSGSFNFDDRPIASLIEDPIPRESHHSYFVQSADLCVFLLKQFTEPSGFMKKHGGNAYFRRLEPVLCKVASYSDPLGIVRL